MLKTILTSVLRQARRHPLFVGLNVIGLALGLAVFLTLIQLVRHEYATNTGFEGYTHIARLDEHWSEPGTTPYESGDASFRSLAFLSQDYPDILAAAPYMEGRIRVALPASGAGTQVSSGREVTLHQVITTSPFFRIVTLEFTQGTARDALRRPDGAILTREAAQMLFGTEQVLGRALDTNKNGVKMRAIVTGVIEAPPAPGFMDGLQIITPASPTMQDTRSCFRNWGSSCGEVFVRLRETADIAGLNRSLPAFVARRASGSNSEGSSLGPDPGKTYSLSLMPLAAMHFADITVQNVSDGVSQAVVDSIGLVGVLALVLACANAINLATARAGLRAREVALRKTLGAPRRSLFLHFTGEALVLACFSGLLGLALCEIAVPFMASMTGEAITMDYGFMAFALPALVLTCGLASGLYPALILSGYRPASILAATRMPSGGRRATGLRNALVTGQFAIAICIVICTLVIGQQTDFTRDADKGFAKDGLLVGQPMGTEDMAQQRLMIDRLRLVPGVTAVSLGELKPNPQSESRSTISYNAPGGKINAQLLLDTVTPGYFDTYRPRLLAGRWFDLSHGEDDWPADTQSNPESPSAAGAPVSAAPATPSGQAPDSTRTALPMLSVILNEKAVHAFGVDRPEAIIGKTLQGGHRVFRVIGVMADMRFGPPRQALPPTLLRFTTLSHRGLVDPIPAIRYHAVTRPVMEERLDRAWAGVLPDVASHFSPAEDKMAIYYTGDEKRSRLFSAGAGAALFIACLGLYGLAAFAAARRVHEIGIRKTLGATAGQVVVLLLQDFLRPVLLACLLAAPVAFFLMRSWLSGFDERIALGGGVFLAAIGGAMAIATCTVLGQTLRLARSAPARALRAE